MDKECISMDTNILQNALEQSITVKDRRTGKVLTGQLWQVIIQEYDIRAEFYGVQLYGKHKVDLRNNKQVKKMSSYAAAIFKPMSLEDVKAIENLMAATPVPTKNPSGSASPWSDTNDGKYIRIHAMCRQMLRAYYEESYQKAVEPYEHNSSEWNRAGRPFAEYYSMSRLHLGLCSRPC